MAVILDDLRLLWRDALQSLKRLKSAFLPPPELPQPSEYILEIPTRDGEKPLKVLAKLFPLPGSWGADAWRIIVDVTGARHPHNDGSSNLLGSDTLKNPAVVPALARLRTLLRGVAIDVTKNDKAGHEQWSPHHDGGQLWLSCTPNDYGLCGQMSLTQVVPTFRKLTDGITAQAETLRTILDENAHLWPEVATPERRVVFNAMAANKWAVVMAGTNIPTAAIRSDDQWAVSGLRNARGDAPGF